MAKRRMRVQTEKAAGAWGAQPGDGYEPIPAWPTCKEEETQCEWEHT
jgi:hypothetical protein